MGTTLAQIRDIFDQEEVSLHAVVLDVGCSNIHSLDVDELIDFVKRRRSNCDQVALQFWAECVAIGGVMDPEIGGTNGAWLGDVLTRAGMEYHALDIFPGYKTEIFDLNQQSLSEEQVGKFDVVLNFGTTEHVLGQWNAFKVIHDAMKVGGIVVHDLPMTGYLNHGFFNYNPMMLDSLAQANEYEVIQLSFSGGMTREAIDSALIAKYEERPTFGVRDVGDWMAREIPTSSVRLIARKTKDAPFRVALETTTTAGHVSSDIDVAYGGEVKVSLKEKMAATLTTLKAAPLGELMELLKAFHASGSQEMFPPSIELKIAHDVAEKFPSSDAETQIAVSLERLRKAFPLLRVPSTETSPTLEFDGVESAFPTGEADDLVFEYIVAAYHRYHAQSAVELFPPRLEAIGLMHLNRERGRDVDVLVRLGHLMASFAPTVEIASISKASETPEHGELDAA